MGKSDYRECTLCDHQTLSPGPPYYMAIQRKENDVGRLKPKDAPGGESQGGTLEVMHSLLSQNSYV